jgi:hypothetical protein
MNPGRVCLLGDSSTPLTVRPNYSSLRFAQERMLENIAKTAKGLYELLVSYLLLA